MSWSVSSSGTPEAVTAGLADQFKYPLDPDAGLPDAGEKETVRLVKALIEQCLGTFDPAKEVRVSAFGHMGYADWENKTGGFQNVTLTIQT